MLRAVYSRRRAKSCSRDHAAPSQGIGTTSPPSVRIRRVEIGDAPAIEQYASDPHIAATSHVPHPYPRGAGLTFVTAALSAWRNGGDSTFAVLADEAFAGLITLMSLNRLSASAQVGYWIAVPQWGRGVATEALRLTVQYAFDELNLNQLGARCLASNVASVRVLQKNGFEERGQLRYQGADSRFAGALLRSFVLQRRPAARLSGNGE